MPKRHEELIGEFDFERNVFNSHDAETRTIVGLLTDGKTVVKGRAAQGSLAPDMRYRFYGYWSEHHKYGRQFQFETFVKATPSGQRGTEKYLARAAGIGPARARLIWEKFGPDSLKAMRERPQEIAATIPCLSEEIVRAAAEFFAAEAGMEATTIELMDLLGSRGFPRRLVPQLIAKFGNTAASEIKVNPYLLMTFKGIGFLRADSLYLALGKPAAAIERQALCLWHACRSDQEGHVWYPLDFCKRAICQNVSGAEVDAKAAVQWAMDHDLVVCREQNGRTWLAANEDAAAETRLAGYVHAAELESVSGVAWPDPMTLNGLTPHQREQLALATAGRMGILAGSPGSGKTFTLARLIGALAGRRVAVCAPTGKAAVRVTESLAAQGVNVAATTIHRLLGVVSGGDEGWRFDHNEQNPLAVDYIFVDEASMPDNMLMAHLLAARSAGCHVLLVGDPDQLPPVGRGSPLRDLIAAKLPYGHLKDIHRNAGRIVRCCAEIRDVHKFCPAAKLDLSAGENLTLISTRRPQQQINELLVLLAKLRTGGVVDPVWDAQVVVPVNEKSPLSRKALNKLLQQELNPAGVSCKGSPFKVGDKIVCTRNGFLPHRGPVLRGVFANAEGQIFVANGEQGRVLDSQPRYTIAALELPKRTVLIPRGDKSGEEGDTGCHWELAYAISVHKSQGSQWPVVIVMLDGYPGAVRLLDRHWVYTAISRASKACFCIGQADIAAASCRKSHMWSRRTLLTAQVEELRAIKEPVESFL